MNSIQVNSILPHFISETEASVSEIWHQTVNFCKGEYYLLSAASGKGKSSLLSYIFGERSDYRGSILYDGRPMDSLTGAAWAAIRQHQLSFVFQGLRLFSDLSAFENIRIKNQLTHHKTDDEITHLLACAGLADKRDEKAAKLSFGQQQRVAIIRALCQPFDFLLMDEPFSHLDEENIAVMSHLIRQELQNKQAGLLLCSLGLEYPFTYHKKYTL